MIPPWLDMVIGIIAATIGSSGLWAFVMNRREKKDVKNDILIGLGHDRIMHLTAKYIERGWMTQDEYENLHDYLFVPYTKVGGNGAAARAMKEVDKLPIRTIKQVMKEGIQHEDQ